MAIQKKISVEDYFAKNSRKFIRFAEMFADMLNDKELVAALAQKDLEKLAKVWKLVLEMMSENTSNVSAEKLLELIGVYNELGKDDEE